MARECVHRTTQAEAEQNLLDAIGAPSANEVTRQRLAINGELDSLGIKVRTEIQEDIDAHDKELLKS